MSFFFYGNSVQSNETCTSSTVGFRLMQKHHSQTRTADGMGFSISRSFGWTECMKNRILLVALKFADGNAQYDARFEKNLRPSNKRRDIKRAKEYLRSSDRLVCVSIFSSRRVVIVSLSNPESCTSQPEYFEFSSQITRNCFSSAKDFVFCAGTTVSLEAPWQAPPWQAPEGFWEPSNKEHFPQHQQLWPPDNR